MCRDPIRVENEYLRFVVVVMYDDHDDNGDDVVVVVMIAFRNISVYFNVQSVLCNFITSLLFFALKKRNNMHRPFLCAWVMHES